MELMLRKDAADFLKFTADYRAANPLETNVMSTVAASVAAGERSYEQYWWWTVSEMYRVIGAGMRTAPHHLLLGPMPTAAAELLGQSATLEDPKLPGVTATPTVLESFKSKFRSLDRYPVVVQRQLLYEVNELATPDVPGAGRVATVDDEPLVLEWLRAFHDEATPNEPHSTDHVRGRLEAGALSLWENGTIVSMAGYAGPADGPTGRVARVGPVYTPASERGHGYGAGVTAFVTKQLLDDGCAVMLYTDASNATSNGVYQRLGYHQVAELVRIDYVSPTAPPTAEA